MGPGAGPACGSFVAPCGYWGTAKPEPNDQKVAPYHHHLYRFAQRPGGRGHACALWPWSAPYDSIVAVSNVEPTSLSLTGPGSHMLVSKPGMGNVSIGSTGGRDGNPDLVVGADDRINWAAFNPSTVGYAWPRGIQYEGNDLGFFEWSERRPIETFFWTPARAVDIDARYARISRLWLTLRGAPMRIVLPRASNGLVNVSVTGDLSLLTVDLVAPDECPSLAFYPDTEPSREAEPLRLPTLEALAGCRSIDVYVSPLRQPFDCASLTQFSTVRHVSLSGGVANVAALADLREVETLRLLYCPDLSALPPLATWPNLRTVLASNIDQTAGKRLRAEIRALTNSGRAWERASVTELRRPDWFDREYGLPFSQWSARTARAATAAFRAAAVTISACETQVDVERAITLFVDEINRMPNIYSVEREDVGEAVCQLAHMSPFDVPDDLALTWFDATRDF